MSAEKYALPKDVFFCLADNYVFFLDLQRDRYCALAAARTAGLGSLVTGWPVDPGRTDSATATAQTASAQLLLRNGLLRKEGADTKPPLLLEITPPRIELPGADQPGSAALPIGKALVVLSLYIASAIRFRCCSLSGLVHRVRRRRERRASHPLPLNPVRAREIVAIFRKMRSLIFTSRDACLFESFALLEILSHYGVFPNWIFGLQPVPFVAHCWLQHDGIVINDTLERIKRLTPIMMA